MSRARAGARETTSPAAIATNERHAEWIALKARGLSYLAIAQQFDVSKQAVQQAVSHYLKQNIVENVEELRAMENARLDVLWEDTYDAAIEQANAGDWSGVDKLIKMSARRARMNSMDQNIHLSYRAEETHIQITAVDYREQVKALMPDAVIEGKASNGSADD